MIITDIQTLEPGGYVQLYELDASELGGELYRFHSYPQESPIWWQGNEYSPWPIKAEGFQATGDGQQPRPRLSVANVTGFISALTLYFDDLIGAKLTRRRTLAQYLDSRNFPEGNPTANPEEEFAVDTWRVDRKISESPQQVDFELCSPLDYGGVQLPRRQIVANVCWYVTQRAYRGPDCGYTGPPVADEFDVITTDAARDRCGGRLASCKLRFGEFGELSYGSFPAAGLIRN